MMKRKMQHELHNESRKLTKKERSEKRKKKLQEDTSRQVHVALFRVADLSDGKKRYKVDIHASQYNLTGRALRLKDEPINLVVVEGGPRGIDRYTKLMLRRIRWADNIGAQPATLNSAPQLC